MSTGVKWSDNTEFVPQTSFGSTDQLVGLTGSNVNAKYPRYLFARGTGTTSTHNVSSTITGSEIVGGTIRSFPSSNITLTLPNASDIYLAMGGTPIVGSYIFCMIENFSNNIINLSKTDINLLITGLVSTEIGPNQTFLLKFSVTNLSPTQITVDGGQSFILPNNIKNLLVVSNNGSDLTGDGSFTNPYLTVNNALSNSIIGSSNILLTPGIYTENISLLPSVGMIGFGNKLSIISGTTTINGVSWDATTNPHLDIESIGFNGTANFTTGTGLQYSSSSIILKNCSLPNGSIFNSTGSIKIIEDTIANNISISTPGNVLIQSQLITGTSTFTEGLTSVSTPLIQIDSSGINGISCVTVQDSIGIPPITVTNCPNLAFGTITLNDQPNLGQIFLFTLDAISYPSLVVNIQGTEVFNPTLVTNINTGVTTSIGFSNNTVLGGGLKYSGDTGANQFTFLCGDHAHITGGNHNFLIGNGSTSNFSGCFVWSDLNGSSTNHFPSANNQSLFFASGGFGINTNHSGGIEGPQAGFHYAHNYGNDGNFLFSGVGAVLDSKIHNNEINPYISTDTLILKYKGSSGTVSNVSFTSLGGAIPSLSSNNIFTGNNSFSQPLSVDNIVGYSTSLRLNPFSTGGTIYIGHDLASVFISIGAGCTSTDFTVQNNTNVLFHVQNNATVSTLNNTLDDGIGNFSIFGTMNSGNISASVTGVVHSSGNETINGNKTFTGTTSLNITSIIEISNPLVSNKTPDNITATTATLSAIQFVGGVLTLNPTLSQALTTPTASAIDTILNSPSTNRGFNIKFVNQSSVATTIIGGTNVSTSGCYLTAGNVVIPAGSQRDFTVVKTSFTPAYTIFG